jgi:hypothetical protein
MGTRTFDDSPVRFAYGLAMISMLFGVAWASEESPGAEQVAAAKAKIVEGDTKSASIELIEAIELGYDSYYALKYEGALSPIRDSEYWPRVMRAFETRNQWSPVLDALLEKKGSLVDRYRLTSTWESSGMPTPDQYAAPIRQVGGSIAGFMGEYREAALIGQTRGQSLRFLNDSSNRPESAYEQIMERAEGSRIVLLNEDHGRTETRLSNLLLVRGLAKRGYTHIALEALSRDKTAESCGSEALADKELVKRGYPTSKSGYYFNDPIYAELLEEAMNFGLIPVAYDSTGMGLSGADREEFQAQKIACILQDPAARVVVIGGHAHISELPDARYPGGLMGARLARVTGLDPVSINTLVLDPSTAHPEVEGFLDEMSGSAGPWLVKNDLGEPHRVRGYDLTVLVPALDRKGKRAHPLSLDGTRRPVRVQGIRCDVESGCILEAMEMGRTSHSIPADRCRMAVGRESCLLFLGKGTYEIYSTNLVEGATAVAISNALVQ